MNSRLLRADSWQTAPEGHRHGHALRRLFEDEDIRIDAVLCLEGRPTVCVKDATRLDDNQIEAIRSKLWNLGATTLLMVERPTQVQLFSTFVRPVKEGETSNAALSDETITDLESAALALRLRKMIRRIETGAIYRDNHAPMFDPKGVVDELLLRNLRELRNLICPDRDLKSYRRAHALIGRFLFSCYLLDRGIIEEAYLTKNGLEPAPDMQRLLEKAMIGQGQTLTILFKALHKDFNGSLFGEEEYPPTDDEVLHFRRFLSGEDLKSGQLSLFKLYDFSFIPVELISSIYQDFIEVEANAEAAPTTKNQPNNSGQRVQGAYYTPPRLAELTVDIATQGWDTLLDKRCLDGACGSGIFITILFVRMAEEWRRRNPTADTKKRYEELKRILAENICGVDINHTACLVACFSLYLAFLDQMEPRAITELREVLERDRAKILPRILWEKDQHPPQLRTVRELDFFDMAPAKEFDLVVGNPPWVSRKAAKTKTAEAWILSEDKNPAAKGLLKSEKNKILFPAGEVATGFMWKASLHSKTGGRVCQVLPSRVFLANKTDHFQIHWLERHRLESVWLLADWRFNLFPGAIAPGFIGRYHTRAEDEALGTFEFVTPKVEDLDPREALIPVQAEDQKSISEADIIAAAKANHAAYGWKRHHWGTPRDLRLVERLMRLPKLERLTYQPGKGEKPNGLKCWARGEGFQPATASTNAPKPIFWKESDRFLESKAPPDGLSLLLRSDTKAIRGLYAKSGLHRARSPEIYKAPLFLINQGFTKFVFSGFDVLFQHVFHAISAPKKDEVKLKFLVALFSTPLAQYLGLHTTANVGIERDQVSFEESLGFPFPLPEDMPDPKAAQAIIDECAVIFDELKTNLSDAKHFLAREPLVAAAKRKLETRVYAYFGIKKWERHLIEDSVEMFLKSSTPSARDSETLITCQPSTEKHRKTYADELVATFQGWTRTKENLWAACSTAPSSGLAMLTFGVGGKGPAKFEKTAEERVEKLLSELRDGSALDEGTIFRTMRSFAFYDGTKVHLLKPLNRRHWTRTAAQNDADAIIAHMMEEGGWGA